MNNAQLKRYKAPVITVVEIEAGGCLLDVSQIHVVNKPADESDVLSKRHFEFDLWADDDIDSQDDGIKLTILL